MNLRNYALFFILFAQTPWLKALPTDDETTTIEFVKENTDKKDLYFLYLLATYQHASGQAAPALKTYKQLLKSDPSPHAYGDLFQLLADTGQFKTVATIYESKAPIFDNVLGQDIQVQLTLAQSYLNTGKNNDAERIFTKLAAQHPDNDHVAYFSTLAYIKNNDLSKAHKLIDTCLANPALKQKHFLFYFLRSKILVHQNKLPQALVSIETSLKLFPRFDHGWLFKSMLLEQMGRVNDAINGYKKFIDLVGGDEDIEKQLIQLLFSQQRFAEALNYLKRVKTRTPEYFFDRALLELKIGNADKALACTDESLKLCPTFTKARLLKMEILLNNKRIDDLLAYVHDWIQAYPEDQSAIHALLLLKPHVPLERLIQTLQKIEKNSTIPQLSVLAAIADLSAENNDSEAALRYYHRVANIAQDPELKSKALFHVGYIHFIRKEHNKLEQALRAATECSPAYPSALNLLAYHYAQKGQHLDEALKLSEQALSEVPHCAYYLDTKGYILLKRGDYQTATQLFKQALEQAPQDATILEHLALAQKDKKQ
ncbi:MAG: tetratricopeptide repeat protein [Candidatus Babeliales bacterium]|jgi:tetratricopeptide (TPR) repeat protein